MRFFAAAAFACGLLAWCSTTYAQSWGPDARLPPGAALNGTIYAAPNYQAAPYAQIAAVPPIAPQATFDDRQQSVVILDNPVVAAAPAQPVYQTGQQFQLLDAARPAAAVGSPVSYNTIEQPSLPPGAVVPDCYDCNCDPWHWSLLPDGIIYHSYLAGPKEPRMAAVFVDDTNVDTKFDGTLGARVGLLRYGNSADFRPQGWQLDVESAAFIRQDLSENSDVDAYDFRVGIPVTYGWDRYQMKIAWYHNSAHLGDEFALKHPDFVRINYSRNAIVWGHSYYLLDALRVYGEVEYAYFVDGGSKPWMIQFGFEYSPLIRGWHGAPFLALNAYLRQENDWGGPLTFETGWQWRGLRGGQLMRAGFYYQTGPGIYGEFFRDSEQLIGGGLWYDF